MTTPQGYQEPPLPMSEYEPRDSVADIVREFHLAEDRVMLVPGGLEHFYSYIIGSWLGVIANRADEWVEEECLRYVRIGSERYGPHE